MRAREGLASKENGTVINKMTTFGIMGSTEDANCGEVDESTLADPTPSIEAQVIRLETARAQLDAFLDDIEDVAREIRQTGGPVKGQKWAYRYLELIGSEEAWSNKQKLFKRNLLNRLTKGGKSAEKELAQRIENQLAARRRIRASGMLVLWEASWFRSGALSLVDAQEQRHRAKKRRVYSRIEIVALTALIAIAVWWTCDWLSTEGHGPIAEVIAPWLELHNKVMLGLMAFSARLNSVLHDDFFILIAGVIENPLATMVLCVWISVFSVTLTNYAEVNIKIKHVETIANTVFGLVFFAFVPLLIFISFLNYTINFSPEISASFFGYLIGFFVSIVFSILSFFLVATMTTLVVNLIKEVKYYVRY